MEAAKSTKKREAGTSIKDSVEGPAAVNAVTNEKERKKRRKKKKKSGSSPNVQTENADTSINDSVEEPAAVNAVINKKAKKKKKKSGSSPNVRTENADTNIKDSVEEPAAVDVVINIKEKKKRKKSGSSPIVQTETADTSMKDSVEGPPAVDAVINDKKRKSGSSSIVQPETADTSMKDSVEEPAAVNAAINKKAKKKKKKSGSSPNVRTENADTSIKDSVEEPAAVNVVINIKEKKKRKKSGSSPIVQTEIADTSMKDSVEGPLVVDAVTNDKKRKSGSSPIVQTETPDTSMKDSVEGPPAIDAVINDKKRKKKKRKKKSGRAPDVQTENQDDKNTGNPVCGNNGVDLTTMVDSANRQLLPTVPIQFLQHVRTVRRKLLILDLNGLLADIVLPRPIDHKPDVNINGRGVFKRPFYFDFLKFCFERFDVGVWSSRSRRIVVRVVDYLFGDLRQKLLFCWDMAHCTTTSFKTIENRHKPIVFKELRRLWEKQYDNLPWKRGDYNESNTVLLDDSPYKALLNPVNTSVFPFTFTYKDADDKSLGPRGDIRVYLEGLANAENVQTFIRLNPFGQSAINDKSSLWCFYSQVLSSLSAEPNHTL